MLLTDGARRIELDEPSVQDVYERLWSHAVEMKGAITAASKLLYALRLRATLGASAVELSPEELNAVQAVLNGELT